MKAFSNGTFNPVCLKPTIVLGVLVDERVNLLERLVCDYYNVKLVSLMDWKVDSEAKKMLCFLLYHGLGYSIGSVSKRYNINSLFLRNCIRDLYVNCLSNADEKMLVDGFLYRIKDNDKKVLT